jgi:hypothetical protein
MSLPFDATIKDLVEAFVPDYQARLHLDEFAPLQVMNVDLSTVSAATDIALGEGDPPRRVVDLNFQGGPDDRLVARVLLYHALLHYHYHVPVHSLLVLLRPITGHADITGRLRYEGRRRRGKMDFTFEVIRLWQEPVEQFLSGGLGPLPLAPLCHLPPGRPLDEALAPVIQCVDERLATEATPEDRATLLTATYVLLGMRVPVETATRLFRGIQAVKESSTYQAIVQESEAKGEARGKIMGKLEALQEMVLLQGQQRFGRPSQRAKNAVRAITDIPRLERLAIRILDATNWRDLLDTP